jgi:antitoxin component YwqK of YwqJK toxin-antitoxin module
MNDKDITPLNDKNQRHGLWEKYYSDGTLGFKCLYHNDKEVGCEQWYYDNKLQERTYHL